MHEWRFTPTFRGFEHFVGFYNAAQDHWTHDSGKYLDLRNDTAPLRDKAGVYSTILYSGAVVEFVEAWAAGGAASVASVAATCADVKLCSNWSVGGPAIAVAEASGADGCCTLCAKRTDCVAFVGD
jgi:hypothetical protein